MNRPNKDYYKSDEYMIFDLEAYNNDLEKYCDFLEWKVTNLGEALNDHIKALDKACNILNQDLYCQDCRYKYSNPSVCDNCGDGQIGEVKWYERLLKEEEK